jgi:hypothetical protein
VADEDDLSTANGLILGSSYGNIPIGAGAFALLSLVPTGNGSFLATHPNAPAFWVDALTFLVTFLVSFTFVRRLTLAGPASRRGGGDEAGHRGGLRDALRLPVVRAVLPATSVAMLGIGVLFSLGVVYVRRCCTPPPDSSAAWWPCSAPAAWPVGDGSAASATAAPPLRTIELAIAAMGVVLAFMSLASGIGLAYLAAVPFGAAAASALIASVTYLQEALAGERRVLGLAVFHVALRIGMSVAAIGGGLLAQVLAPVRLPVVGSLRPAVLVLFGAGVAMMAGPSSCPTDCMVANSSGRWTRDSFRVRGPAAWRGGDGPPGTAGGRPASGSSRAARRCLAAAARGSSRGR